MNNLGFAWQMIYWPSWRIPVSIYGTNLVSGSLLLFFGGTSIFPRLGQFIALGLVVTLRALLAWLLTQWVEGL